MAFRVGQKVVCVDDSNVDRGSPTPDFICVGGMDGLTLNTIYTIRAVVVCYGDPCLLLDEIVRPLKGLETMECGFHVTMECGFHVCRFRPVVERKTDISIFTAMLNPSREPSTVN